MSQLFGKRRWIPASIILISVVTCAIFLRFYLTQSTHQFVKDFERQNLSELAAGDTVSLSRRLGSLSSSVPWVCIKGSKSAVVFYEQKNGSCETGLLVQHVRIDHENRGGISLDFSFTLPRPLKQAGLVFISMQLLLLLALGIAASREERFRLQHVLEKQKLEGEMNALIAQTTQMLAHDVRRPFQSMELGLSMIESESDPVAIKEMASILSKEVKKSSASVKSMLEDLLSAGGLTQLKREKTDISCLIEELMADASLGVSDKIVLQKEFRHSHEPQIDRRKIHRVLGNILGNAKEAMQGSGRIWIRTKDVFGSKSIELTLGNSGPHIPEDKIEKIFDAFFTSGKKNGTGLGLAIAQKIIRAHGGTITCRSAPEFGVEFSLVLPLGE